jgi:hypothetical protein
MNLADAARSKLHHDALIGASFYGVSSSGGISGLVGRGFESGTGSVISGSSLMVAHVGTPTEKASLRAGVGL